MAPRPVYEGALSVEMECDYMETTEGTEKAVAFLKPLSFVEALVSNKDALRKSVAVPISCVTALSPRAAKVTVIKNFSSQPPFIIIVVAFAKAGVITF